MASLNLQGAQAGGVHVGGRHVEPVCAKVHRCIPQSLMCVRLRHKSWPGAHPHGTCHVLPIPCTASHAPSITCTMHSLVALHTNRNVQKDEFT